MATTGTGAVATGTSTTEKRKPVFVKVEQLKPGTNGHTLTVKVVDANTVVPINRKTRPATSLSRPSQPSRIVECLIGDETGCILFTARNDQGKSDPLLSSCLYPSISIRHFSFILRKWEMCLCHYLENITKSYHLVLKWNWNYCEYLHRTGVLSASLLIQ